MHRAVSIARQLDLPLCPQVDAGHYDLLLGVDQGGLFLQEPGREKQQSKLFRIDLTKLDVSSAVGRRMGQPLIRAVRGRKRYKSSPLVMDCSGGFGQDSWLLASLGHMVICVERDPLVFCLLQDAWARAGVVHKQVATRIRLLLGDSGQVLTHLARGISLFRPDVAFFDPMFPGERRRAKQKRAMCLLRSIVGSGGDRAGDLQVLTALRAVGKRVVVKRPSKGPAWTGFPPDHSLQGRGLRYDIYFKESLSRLERLAGDAPA